MTLKFRWLGLLSFVLMAFAATRFLPAKESASGTSRAVLGDWPQWRGPKRDGHATATGLLTSWPAGGPALVWTARDLGRGYGSPAVVGDRLYLLGADGKQALAICLDRKSGERLWATELGEQFENNWGGGPRSTPTVDGDRLYALDAVGTLACLDVTSGQIHWKKSLVKDFGGGVPGWGYCESPLVDGNRVLVTPGGKNCIVALDKQNGETIWTSQGLEEGAHYSSIVTGQIGGKHLYFNMTSQGLVVVSNEGKLLSRFNKSANGTATIPTPVVDEEYVYTTSGYGAGCGLVKINVEGENATAEEIYATKDLKNHHGGVVLVDGYIYGHSDGGGWVCQNMRTGEVKWNERSLSKGSVCYADGRLYCYAENDGACTLVDPDPAEFRQVGQLQLPEKTGINRQAGAIWAHPVVAHGQLYLRDQDLLFCFDVRKK